MAKEKKLVEAITSWRKIHTMVYRRCEESRVDGLFICKGMYDL